MFGFEGKVAVLRGAHSVSLNPRGLFPPIQELTERQGWVTHQKRVRDRNADFSGSREAPHTIQHCWCRRIPRGTHAG